jgi:CRP/FNR family transcriptional regulator
MGAAETKASAAYCDVCPVYKRTVCSVLGSKIQKLLAEISVIKIFPAGSVVIGDGSGHAFVGSLLRGVVRQSRVLRDGREQIVGLAYPGEFLSQSIFGRLSFTIEAATDVEMCVAERPAFEALCDKEPRLRTEVMRRCLDDVSRANERVLMLASQSTLERVATYLLVTLARRELLLFDGHAAQHKRVSASSISRKDMASYLGTTMETISRHTHYLASKGIIRILDSAHFEVLDYDRLFTIAGVTDEELELLVGDATGRAHTPKLPQTSAHIRH